MGGGMGPGVQLLLVAAFAGLAAFYASRAAEACLPVHAPHLLMALGMVYMTLPAAWQRLPLVLWLGVYVSASAWCIAGVTGRWRRHHHLDWEFVHSELAGCLAMTLMLPLFTVGGMVAALPLAIALGTYYLGYSGFWIWRAGGRGPGLVDGEDDGRPARSEAVARVVMGAGMAYMFLVM